MPAPHPSNLYLWQKVHPLLRSYADCFGKPLTASQTEDSQSGKALWELPGVVVAHGIGDDPVFFYGNKAALALFEMTWERFTALPSRLSAEPGSRKERELLLAEVREKGFSTNYSGIRISSTGKRFRIENAAVWNIISPDGHFAGQAAYFDRWSAIG